MYIVLNKHIIITVYTGISITERLNIKLILWINIQKAFSNFKNA